MSEWECTDVELILDTFSKNVTVNEESGKRILLVPTDSSASSTSLITPAFSSWYQKLKLLLNVPQQ